MKKITTRIKQCLVIVFCNLILIVPTAFGDDSWFSRGLNALNFFSSDSEEQVSLESLTAAEINAGLQEALAVGTERVVAQLGVEGGFEADPIFHIALPTDLIAIREALARVGMEGMMANLEPGLNQAAEIALPVLQPLLLESIAQLSLADGLSLYQGDNSAATAYFRDTMAADLSLQIQPVIHDSLTEVGVTKAIGQIMSKYNSLPLVPEIKVNLDEYVVGHTLTAIFYYLAEEEAAIREDPLERSTKTLMTVFGASK